MAQYKYLAMNFNGETISEDYPLEKDFLDSDLLSTGDLYGGYRYAINWEKKMYIFQDWSHQVEKGMKNWDLNGAREFIKKDRNPTRHSVMLEWIEAEPYRECGIFSSFYI